MNFKTVIDELIRMGFNDFEAFQLVQLAYDSAKDAHEGTDIPNEDLLYIGMEFLLDNIYMFEEMLS